jgi:hypothetical protein
MNRLPPAPLRRGTSRVCIIFSTDIRFIFIIMKNYNLYTYQQLVYNIYRWLARPG